MFKLFKPKFLNIIKVSLISMMLIGCSAKKSAINDARYVQVFAITSDVNQMFSTFPGVVHAEFEPSLAFRVAGKVISRNVDIGQLVKKDQLLASLDATDYLLAKDSAVAELAAANSNLISQKANLERYRELLKENFVAKAQFDTQQAQYDSALAKYEEAKNQLANAQNQVKYTQLTASADGVISSINVNVGQVVSAGQAVATMAVAGNKEIEIELPETQINTYKVGMPAKITIWATKREFAGKIKNINQASDTQTRTYTARVVITSPDNQIKYGMAADVAINVDNQAQGFMLPITSLYVKDGKSYVWLLDSQSKAKLIPVTVSYLDDEKIKIQSEDIKLGDKVVSAGTNFIYAGQKLIVYKN